MNLPLFIAGRYLFAKKSHNVINIISAISSIGMGIGTAALVIILSVYNGFDGIIQDSMDHSAPDILVTPSSSKVFDSGDISWIKELDGVGETDTYLEENIFLTYDGNQAVAKARGVDDISLWHGEIPLCAVSTTLAQESGINPNFVSPVYLYYPSRTAKFSPSNPSSMLRSIRVHPKRLFPSNSDEEGSLMLVPMSEMRELLDYPTEISAIEVRMYGDATGKQLKNAIKAIESRMEDVKVLDRYHQNESLYKMMRYEKAAIFLILIFVVIIIAFNIFGSLSMLMMEKKEDIVTFRSLGATNGTIRRIFVLEGWLISLLGLAGGMVSGLLVCFLQQKFGLVAMPGNYLVNAYPVTVKLSDLALISAGVASVGYMIASLPTVRTKQQ